MRNSDYHLIRSNRRSVALIIRDGRLVVRAPWRVSLSEVERFIRLKQSWINKHLKKAAERSSNKKKFEDGEKFWFLGQEYPLRVVDEYRSRLIFSESEFVLSRFRLHRAKSLFESWYRSQAKKILVQSAKFHAQKIGVIYKRISVTGANTRWGSCSNRGTINFSWRLIMAPVEIIDYVIIHELAHLTHHNHSKKFWQLVSQFAPHYKHARNWLRIHGLALSL